MNFRVNPFASSEPKKSERPGARPSFSGLNDADKALLKELQEPGQADGFFRTGKQRSMSYYR